MRMYQKALISAAAAVHAGRHGRQCRQPAARRISQLFRGRRPYGAALHGIGFLRLMLVPDDFDVRRQPLLHARCLAMVLQAIVPPNLL